VKRARWELLIVLFVLTLVSGALFLRPTSGWLDQSSESFLPKAFAKQLSIYRNYPVFWWNLLVIEGTPGTDPDLASVAQFCRTMLQDHSKEISLLPCATDLGQYRPLLADWVRDLPARRPSPSQNDAKTKVAESLAKMSLPLGEDLLAILRNDPFQSFRDLQARGTESVKFDLEKYPGFFFDRPSGRVVIPIQFAFAPNEASKTAAVLESARRLIPTVAALGPHISNYENETQVKDDVQNVSIAGGVLLVVVSAVMLFLGQWRLLLFYPFLVLSTMASVTLTVWWFGQVHGLVLAFGPGIIGLSMDYAVHAAFAAAEKDETWLANAIGLLTTITVVVVGYFSSLPVIQQLMFFSGAGLSIGFVVFYMLDRSEPYLFRAEIFMKKPFASRALAIGTIATAVCAVLGVALAKPALGLNDIGYESTSTHKLEMWLAAERKLTAPVLTVFSGSDSRSDVALDSPLATSARQEVWSHDNGIEMKTISQYLPPVTEQRKNLESWKAGFCSWKPTIFRETTALFSPFLKSVTCDDLRVNELKTGSTSYLRDFKNVSDGSWITLWFPKDKEQLEKIQKAFPETSSLAEIAKLFPITLAREIYWMMPAIFLLSTALLAIYYRKTWAVFLANLPFLTGLGSYFIAYAIFDLKMSFVSLIGFIMIFGFSLDYGIFAANVEDAVGDHGAEVRSALTLTTTMTLAGFLPLLFAKHPAMKHLGEALVTGTIGTYLGAVSAVPYLFKRFRR
jgi:predicted exporter